MRLFKVILSILCLAALLSVSIAGLAEGSGRQISIDLDQATDEELAAALDLIKQEQKARIVTKLTLDHDQVTIGKGKTQKLVPQVTDMADNVKLKKYEWSTSDNTTAKVTNGTVTGVKSGKAVITCKALLSDGLELTASCTVTVVTTATSLTVKEPNVTLGIGKTYQINATVKPDDTTNKKLDYKSENSEIVTVSSSGLVTAVHGGKTTVTITTTDGSKKSAKVTIYVPSVSATVTNYSVTSKSGKTITIDYYGTRSNLNVSSTGTAGSVSYSLSGNKLSITVDPERYGNMTITVSDKSDARSKVVLKVTVEHSAVYDTYSYPKIQYTEASRYPSSYRGDKCSFSGRVLQVIDGSGENAYRISSKGRYNDVVYVTIKKSDIRTPILEDDWVTVYGSYNGTKTYTTVLGASMTILSVSAEKINVK